MKTTGLQPMLQPSRVKYTKYGSIKEFKIALVVSHECRILLQCQYQGGYQRLGYQDGHRQQLLIYHL